LHLITLNDTHTHIFGTTFVEEGSTRCRNTWQHTTSTRDRYPCPLRDPNAQSEQASGRRNSLRPRIHQDRLPFESVLGSDWTYRGFP